MAALVTWTNALDWLNETGMPRWLSTCSLRKTGMPRWLSTCSLRSWPREEQLSGCEARAVQPHQPGTRASNTRWRRMRRCAGWPRACSSAIAAVRVSE
eukprot:CAMPEP_0179925908 /NCGR_PEP_ID=MMETSP0983-20121128/7505_1 /TAXON_ID=483367 /ORGANISM="non described non described, Strain CCMP 2436" /LENGTH=97 /DNA_ID=CAMNT_0021829517 /DNA_START=36 /DNA_END=329 /DNA_ORIENTATION=+